MLVNAYRARQVRPEDVDTVSSWVEWVDTRIGWLARQDIAERREAAASRVRGAVALFLMVALAAVVFVSFGAPRFLLGACGVALLATLIVLAVNVRLSAELIEDETGKSSLADL